jgi:hypothetical protein
VNLNKTPILSIYLLPTPTLNFNFLTKIRTNKILNNFINLFLWIYNILNILLSFEQLFKMVVENYKKLTDKKKTLAYLRYRYDLMNIHKQKLKLGKITFEIKEYMDGEIVLFEKLEMIFSRQDNTEENELNVENRLKTYE